MLTVFRQLSNRPKDRRPTASRQLTNQFLAKPFGGMRHYG